MKFQLTARDGAGREVEDKWFLPRPGPSKGNRVCAEQRLCATGWGHPGMVGGHWNRDQIFAGNGFHLRPKRGEWDPGVESHGPGALVAELFGKRGPAGLEVGRREATTPI